MKRELGKKAWAARQSHAWGRGTNVGSESIASWSDLTSILDGLCCYCAEKWWEGARPLTTKQISQLIVMQEKRWWQPDTRRGTWEWMKCDLIGKAFRVQMWSASVLVWGRSRKKGIAKYQPLISGGVRLAFNKIGNRGGRADFGVRENRAFSSDVQSFSWPLDIQVNPELTYEEMKLKEVNKLFRVAQTGF